MASLDWGRDSRIRRRTAPPRRRRCEVASSHHLRRWGLVVGSTKHAHRCGHERMSNNEDTHAPASNPSEPPNGSRLAGSWSVPRARGSLLHLAMLDSGGSTHSRQEHAQHRKPLQFGKQGEQAQVTPRQPYDDQRDERRDPRGRPPSWVRDAEGDLGRRQGRWILA
jgi:hypothetical protein